jgi:hypothetical protein
LIGPSNFLALPSYTRIITPGCALPKPDPGANQVHATEALVGGIGILIGLVALLAINYKWAGLDPHNPAAGPTWLWAVIGALWTMALFYLALVLTAEGHPTGAALVGAYALGSDLGPSISTPHRLTKQEKPSAVMRFLEAKRASIGGGLNNCATIPLPTELRVGYDIFKKPVSTSAAQKIWRGNKHTGCHDLATHIRNKYGHAFAR